jgi:hypothetical protein
MGRDNLFESFTEFWKKKECPLVILNTRYESHLFF